MPKIDKQKQLEDIAQQIQKCKVCSTSGKGMLVPGMGSAKAKIVFVGEAPGKKEVETGQPFIGPAGKILTQLVESIGINREDVFITSAVKYLPREYVTPKPHDIEHGRTHLFAQLEVIKPKVIILLGNVATIAILNEKFSIAKDHGSIIMRNGLTYFLSYHPAAPLYSPKLKEILFKDFKKLKKLL